MFFGYFEIIFFSLQSIYVICAICSLYFIFALYSVSFFFFHLLFVVYVYLCLFKFYRFDHINSQHYKYIHRHFHFGWVCDNKHKLCAFKNFVDLHCIQFKYTTQKHQTIYYKRGRYFSNDNYNHTHANDCCTIKKRK